MEVIIPDDVFKDMMEPGKVFQRRLEPRVSADKTPQRPLASLLLEKMADDVIKIVVSVETAEAGEKPESSSKMDLQQNEVSNSSQQTDNAGTESRLMQTERKDEKTQQQQTDKKEVKTSGDQTTSVQYKDSSMQTDIKEFSETHCQTIVKQFRETPCQTVIKTYSNVPSQTVIKEFNKVTCQTDFSLANLKDSDCQATTTMCNGDSQTEIETSENGVQATTTNMDSVSQTEILCSDSSIQTEKNETVQESQTQLSMLYMFDNTCQTEIDIASTDAQTDSSMAYMQEFGCQIVPNVTELSVQTEPNAVRAVPCQTEIITQYAETQTVPDLNNRETQTDPISQESPQVNANQNVDMSMPPTLEENMPVEGDLILPSADIQSITPLAVVPMNQGEKNEVSIQTDPVTIIIGDASFLVEKLKGSSIKTEKKEREIEIEFAENGTAEVRPKSRSGYIPGSGLSHFGSPPLPGRIPKEKLRSTPVQPFNPRAVEDIQSLRAPKEISPIKMSPIRRQPEKTFQRHELSYDGDGPEVKQELNCPFCEATFPDSTVLYQHITNMHNEKRKKTHYKPRGREGMTVIPKRPSMVPSNVSQQQEMPDYVRASVEKYRQMAIASGKIPPGEKSKKWMKKPQAVKSPMSNPRKESGYQSPPVLEPVYMVSQVQLVHEDGQSFTLNPSGKTYKRQAPKIQAEPNLFEDLPEPKRAYPRGRVRRDEGDEETSTVAKPQSDAYEYECPHCPERYGSASHLYAHLKRSHKKEMEQQRNEDESNDENEDDHSAEAEELKAEDLEEVYEGEEDVKNEEDSETQANDGEEEVEDKEDVEEGGEGEEIEEEAVAEEEEADEVAEPEDEEVENEEDEEHEEAEDEHELSEEEQSPEPVQGKRKRKSVGRPPRKKKYAKMSEDEVENTDEQVSDLPDLQTPKRGRGRPRKDASKTPGDTPQAKKVTRTRKSKS